jgi:hypothetical protein
MKISVAEEEPELHYPLVGDREEDERRGFLDAVVGEHERSDPVNLITKPMAAIGHGCRRRHLPCDRGAYDFALPLFGDYLRGGRKLRKLHAS